MNQQLEREAYRVYLRCKSTDAWSWLGDDNEDMSVEMNIDKNTIKNVKGQTRVTIGNITPTTSVDPYYAKPDDLFYQTVLDCALGRKKADVEILEVVVGLDDEITAYREDAILTTPSYGGDTNGFGIPFDLDFNGNRQKVNVTISDNVPVITGE